MRLDNSHLKMLVREYWDQTPCGTENLTLEEDSPAFFQHIERERYSLMPYLPVVLGFDAWPGKRVLEVGCGVGTDLMQFARHGAVVTGIDLNRKSVSLTRRSLQLHHLEARLVEGDTENLPFADSSFDMVYSWGVIHHTPDTQKALDEMYRVLKPGGRLQVMVYHLKSWTVAKVLLKWGLLHGELFTYGFQRMVDRHAEAASTKNPLAKVYTLGQVKSMTCRFKNMDIQVIASYCDEKSLPRWLTRLFRDRIGWFLVVKGDK